MNCRKMILSALQVLIMIAVLSMAAASARADNGLQTLRETSKAFSAVANKAIPAVVSVKVEKAVEAEQSFGHQFPFGEQFFDPRFRNRQQPPRKHQQFGQGSGFIISEDGYILTNNHLVGDAEKVTVKLTDGREFTAETIGTDPKSDVAVIKIDGENLPVIELGDSDAAEIGEWVIAIGNPFGLAATVTVGIISAKGRSNIGLTDYENFIQTDAAVNPGNSGGPLLNLEGKAVGISTAIFSRSGGYMGISFAIPANMARAIKDQLVESGTVTRGKIGAYIQDVTIDLARSFDLKTGSGVLIGGIVAGSPAEKAGLKEGDIVLKLDDEAVENAVLFRNAISMRKPGSTVDLLVYRDGREKKITVRIGSLDDTSAEIETAESRAKLDLDVQNLTRELARRFGYETAEGVIVSRVQRGGYAAKAGIQPGMLIVSVNRKQVSSVSEFNTAVEKSAESGKVLLLIKHEQASRYVVLPLE